MFSNKYKDAAKRAGKHTKPVIQEQVQEQARVQSTGQVSMKKLKLSYGGIKKSMQGLEFWFNFKSTNKTP